MREKTFRFKQFEVLNDKTAMKVGTDGVLLGAWCDVDGACSVLDVGTGCGVIALMIAQRNANCKICGVEIDSDAASEAEINFRNSPWGYRLHVECGDFLTTDTTGCKYDLIVSNPPFFLNGVKSPNEARKASRHEDLLPIGKLLEVAAEILSGNGRLCLVYPADNDSVVEENVTFSKFSISKKVHVATVAGQQPKRTLWELVLHNTTAEHSTLAIENENREFSEEYIRLTKDFYLKM